MIADTMTKLSSCWHAKDRWLVMRDTVESLDQSGLLTPLYVGQELMALLPDPGPFSLYRTVLGAVANAAFEAHPLPYHGPQHHAEVTLILAMLLYRLHPNDWGLAGPVLVAAMGHDLGYDPKGKKDAFGQETRAAAQVAQIAQQHGLDAQAVTRLHDLVLATFPPMRAPIRAALGGCTDALLGPLQGLASQPDGLYQAALLSDADLFASAALGGERSCKLGQKLAAETGVAASRTGVCAFFDHLVGPGFLSHTAQDFDAFIAPTRQSVLDTLTE